MNYYEKNLIMFSAITKINILFTFAFVKIRNKNFVVGYIVADSLRIFYSAGSYRATVQGLILTSTY